MVLLTRSRRLPLWPQDGVQVADDSPTGKPDLGNFECNGDVTPTTRPVLLTFQPAGVSVQPASSSTSKEHERDVVRHQQRRNPECGIQ
jgi:hypothetical protein